MSSAAPSLPDVREHASRRIRVLVVEDSIDHQTLMRRRLEGEGIDVRVASESAAALEQVDDVDLVLLDYRLPGASGLELLDQIAERPRAPSVVMVTGAGSTDVAVEAMRAGAIDYVAKEAGYLDDLPDVVRRAWRHHDVTQRADELQRLALLISSARDRETLSGEIVEGARWLLRARACALLLERHGELRAATVLGDEPDDLGELLALDLGSLGHDAKPRRQGDRLLVPLPHDDGVPLGLLAAWSSGTGYGDEEVELGRAFASFAGIALRNLRQRELEHELLAELRQTVDARRDFIASVSHELRTPLTAIRGFVETLHDNWDHMAADNRLDLLRRVGRNAGDLQVLVDELIDLAALDRGRPFNVELEPVRLDEAVEQSVDDSAELLEGREVTLDAEPVTVQADVSLVRRTMANLLTNAVKFSTDGTAITLGVTHEGDVARVRVTDRGIGLEPRAAARVFEPFFRGTPSVANAVRGSGIGLALVKEYVRTMAGQVGLDSTPGEGSTFWFTLPVTTD